MLISSLSRTASYMTIQKMLLCYKDKTTPYKGLSANNKVLIDGFHTTLGYVIVALGYKRPSNTRVTAPIVLPLVVTTTNSLSQLESNDLDLNVVTYGPKTQNNRLH
ncbi:hypothetical protein BJ546DRAFT_949460 [Cryomyces antarcticus]